jgi:DNA-binding NarL/FixJ family response regulator
MDNSVKVKGIFGIAPDAARTKLKRLTRREFEVAGCMAKGLTNPQIAKRLNISWKTLDIHRSKIKEKLKVSTHGIFRIWFAAQFG